MELPSFYTALKINLLYLLASSALWGFLILIFQKRVSMNLYIFLICFTAGALTWLHFYIIFQEATTYSPGFKSINKFIGNLTAKISVAIYLILIGLNFLFRWLLSFGK